METKHRDLVNDWFAWTADLCADPELATLGEVHRLWADNGRIVTHGAVRADGIAALEKLFGLFPSQYETVAVQQPFHTYIEAGDQVVLEFDILIGAREPASRQEFRVMMILSIVDGKIVEMREVSAVKAGGF
ncbi:nuclear transport factor 2 family protein [Kutzneria sp. NPDC052558]|uniref:nuclear transport factor 2 family protein n=1 Tax=Kutzneria sp. NPDC052558 TaxID=3364121 RepID=UPI0037C77E00